MAVEIQAQFDGQRFHPYTEADKAAAKDYQKNQIVTLKITGTQRAPNLPQLRLYWACCAEFAEQVDDKDFRDREMVSDQLKVALNFVDLNRSFVDKDGTFHPHYRSISFRNLRQMERDRYIDRALEQMAEWLGCTVEELTETAAER